MSGSWLRVTIGSEEENRRFVEALDVILTSH
jgi:histidinol-phosphate/aromatic aminotransferase/cobyric acid decarboxylase-like protein